MTNVCCHRWLEQTESPRRRTHIWEFSLRKRLASLGIKAFQPVHNLRHSMGKRVFSVWIQPLETLDTIHARNFCCEDLGSLPNQPAMASRKIPEIRVRK